MRIFLVFFFFPNFLIAFLHADSFSNLGYLQAPATIDLASVRLITTLEPEFVEYDDDFFMDDDDSERLNDDDGFANDDDEAQSGNDDVATMAPTKAPTKNHHKTEPPTAIGDDEFDADGDLSLIHI